MPLPAALLQRLSKRGIIGDNKAEDQAREDEEIIAESYDDDLAAVSRRSQKPLHQKRRKHDSDDEENRPTDLGDYEQYLSTPYSKTNKPSNWSEQLKKRIADCSNWDGYKGCPNKYNIYHKCTIYCINRWGDGIKQPSSEYLKRQKRLLKRYPLPKDWIAVYDNGFGCHYYWNSVDDVVSWLPPDHPKSEISKTAAALRRELDAVALPLPSVNDGLPDYSEAENLIAALIEQVQAAPKSPPMPMLPPELPPPIHKKPKPRDLDKVLNKKSKKQTRSNNTPLDPMDPASYSDIPRGKWSAGLLPETEKTVGMDIDRGEENDID